jgi:hypothetical protein
VSVDSEKPIDTQIENENGEVSTVSTAFEGLGEKIDYEYSEDE